jgi:hypothetical protein
MIRTKLVELSTIEAAAYRRRLKGGKSGVVIIRYDTAQPGLATINKGTGEPDPAANVPKDLFPMEAFKEAFELTLGMPYCKRGGMKLSTVRKQKSGPPKSDIPVTVEMIEAEDDTPEEAAVVDSSEYAAIVKAYTNKKGELSYQLLNRDFIKFAKRSKLVGQMVADKASVDDIRNHIVQTKLIQLTGNKSLTEAQVKRIVEMLDDVSPRHVFRELNDEIRKMLSR